MLIAFFLPGRPTFAVDSFIAQRWWVKPFLPLVDSFSIDPARPLAARSLIKAVEAGRHCVIFPEGRITVTGALMKIYEGPGMIADKADAMILPLRIDGAQYTPFSRLQGKLRRRWFPKITLTLLPPRKLAVDPALRGRARRQAIGLELYDLMTNMVFATTNYRRTLFEALLEARHIHGGRTAHRRGHPPQAPQLQPPARRQLRPGPRARRALGAGRAGGPAAAQFGRRGRRLLRPHRHGTGAGPAQLQHRPRRHEIGLPRRGDPDHRDGARPS